MRKYDFTLLAVTFIADFNPAEKSCLRICTAVIIHRNYDVHEAGLEPIHRVGNPDTVTPVINFYQGNGPLVPSNLFDFIVTRILLFPWCMMRCEQGTTASMAN